MTAKKRRWWHRLLVRQYFTPRGFLLTAVELCAIFLILHVAGLRSRASVLIGAAASRDAAGTLMASLGLAYILFYFAFVTLAPILLLAAGLFKGLLLLLERRRGA